MMMMMMRCDHRRMHALSHSTCTLLPHSLSGAEATALSWGRFFSIRGCHTEALAAAALALQCPQYSTLYINGSRDNSTTMETNRSSCCNSVCGGEGAAAVVAACCQHCTSGEIF
jgi:hypothetical protein